MTVALQRLKTIAGAAAAEAAPVVVATL